MHRREEKCRFDRRKLLALAVGSGAALAFNNNSGDRRAVAAEPAVAPAGGASQLRVIAYNILKCTGWPADRPLAKIAAERGQIAERIALELALYDPHIVTFSESPNEQLTRQIADKLGMHHVRFPSGEQWPGTLLTRFEVLESANAPVVQGPRPADLFTRHWGRAVLQRPGGATLIVHSAHLYPGQDPQIRLREIRAMLESMQADLSAGKEMILMGDLNHGPASEESSKWRQAGWIDTWAALRPEQDAMPDSGMTFPADQPRIRIDYVWCAGPLTERIAASRPLWCAAFRTNAADPESFALSDHVPQFAAWSESSSR